jgi:hypothetical protein
MQLKYWVAIAGIAACGVVAAGSFDRVGAVTTVLYSGSTVTPDLFNAPNPYLTFWNPDGGTQTADGSKTTLDTTIANSAYAGYTNYNAPPLTSFPFTNPLTSQVNSAFPILDRNAGYTLSFTIKITSQTNDGTNGPNRAGFSALVLGSDNQGIEIGFRNSDIFSQGNASFNSIGDQATGLDLAQPATYNLNVAGSTYTLTSGSNTLLNGSLVDYTTATGLASGVYRTPNFIFLGDNTTSARASVDISNITLSTNTAAAVPEPSSLLGTLLALGFGTMLKRRLRKMSDRSIE